MKKELPPAAIAAIIGLGLLVLGGVWLMSGGTGAMSPSEQKLAVEQSETWAEREKSAAEGGMTSEEQARNMQPD